MTTGKLEGQALHRRTEADAKAPAFYAASLAAPNFSFEAYGLTKESCLDAMCRAVTEHCTNTMPAEGALLHANIECLMAGVRVNGRAMGEGYRDGVCLTGGK